MTRNKSKKRRVSRASFVRALQITAVVLTSAAVILGIICAIGYFSTPRLTIEAGESITPQDFVRDSDAYFGEDFDPASVNRAGVYYFTVISGGKHIEVRLRVKDTTPPEVEVRELLWGMGTPAPVPADFIASADEAGDFTGEFVEPLPEITRPGRYTAKIRFTDEWGNVTEVYSVAVTVISDTRPPTVTAPDKVEVYVGDPRPDYSQLVSASDNCIGNITFRFYDGDVDYGTKGSYTVRVIATDGSGNKSEVNIKVTVLEKAS